MTPEPTDPNLTTRLIEAAHEIAADLPPLSEEIDRLRKLPHPLPERLAEAGFHKMMLGKAYGGLGVDPITTARMIEILSTANGSVGWTVMITIGTPHWVTAMITDEAADEIFAQSTEAVLVGTMWPHGRAARAEGGLHVTGQWPFASGIQVANWITSGCALYEGDSPVTDDEGIQELAMVVTPAADCTLVDTWDTTGLRGTGSHDYTMAEAFVPEHRVLKHPFRSKPQNLDPITSYLALSAPLLVAVSVGIARGAVEELKRHLKEKDGPVVAPEALTDLGRAEALVGSATLYMHDMLDRVWALLTRGDSLPTDLRARFRGALTHGVQASVEAVDIAFQTAGAAALYKGHPLERHFRDIHTAASHAKFRSGTMVDSGRLLVDPESYKGEF